MLRCSHCATELAESARLCSSWGAPTSSLRVCAFSLSLRSFLVDDYSCRGNMRCKARQYSVLMGPDEPRSMALASKEIAEDLTHVPKQEAGRGSVFRFIGKVAEVRVNRVTGKIVTVIRLTCGSL